MPVLTSSVDRKSERFAANEAAMRDLVADLQTERAKAALNQEFQKLTCLEKGMLEALKSGRGARSIHRKGTDKAA